MTMKRVAASLFKTRCLKLLDEVAETGEPIVITKRGRPVARVIPERVKRARLPLCK
ncbi:MAG: type II toxin-antitoxin system Phd/YefM family antitoxin, partial [Myxococcales bacterium]